MEIRILSEDGEELWVKLDAAIMKTPSDPREEVFQRIAFAFDWALKGYTKTTQTYLDDRPVVIVVSEPTIEAQQDLWAGCPIYIDLSHLSDEGIHKLRFGFTSKWETVHF